MDPITSLSPLTSDPQTTSQRADPMMERRTFLGTLGLSALTAPLVAEAQPAARVYRVGVVLEGGPYYAAIDGLRAGLKELGFEEGKQYILDIRDVKGTVKCGCTEPRSSGVVGAA